MLVCQLAHGLNPCSVLSLYDFPVDFFLSCGHVISLPSWQEANEKATEVALGGGVLGAMQPDLSRLQPSN
jgi:hypothetical protein